MKKYAFGVDIGGTTCKIGFFDTNGTLLDKWEIKTNTENNGESILSDVAKAVDNKLAQEAISKDDVQGIGIGVPGPVDSQGVVHRCVNLGWGVVNVAEELGNLTGLTIKVGNDANVAALGEMWQGGAKGSKDVIMVTLGTGVGGELDVRVQDKMHPAVQQRKHRIVPGAEAAVFGPAEHLHLLARCRAQGAVGCRAGQALAAAVRAGIVHQIQGHRVAARAVQHRLRRLQRLVIAVIYNNTG